MLGIDEPREFCPWEDEFLKECRWQKIWATSSAKCNSIASWEERLIVRSLSNVKIWHYSRLAPPLGWEKPFTEIFKQYMFLSLQCMKRSLGTCTQCYLVKYKRKNPNFQSYLFPIRVEKITNCILRYWVLSQGNPGPLKLPHKGIWSRVSQDSHVVIWLKSDY